jgi:hypothetical protein
MSDISNQLIKDSYNYVLQSDLGDGIVYRIGGTIPVNPKFLSGLTVNSGFTYSNGTEGVGYALLTDGTGYAYWAPVSAATPSSGVTSITATNGLSGNVTTGAVTIVNTAPDQTVTITGGTSIQITGTYPDFGVNYTGTTIIQGITGITGTSGVSASTTDYVTTIINTAPDRTVILSGGTNIGVNGTYPDFSISFTGSIPTQGITAITATNGVSANTSNNTTTIINTAPDQTVTISGGTGITTGGTYPNFTLVNSAPDRTVTITGGTNIQITGTYPDFGVNFTGTTTGGTFSGDYLPLSGGTVTGGTIFQSGLTANTISATTYFNLPIDVYVTGGTYTGSNILFTNNTGGTFTVTGLTASGLSANYYGSFSDNTNQVVSGSNIPTVWRYSRTELSNGIIVSGGTKIVVQNTGVYEIGYSPQIEKTQGNSANVTIWAAINGNSVDRSSSTLSLVSNSTLQLPFVSLIFELNANDYVEFYFSSDNQHVQLTALNGLTTPTRPDSPSIIIVAKQIGTSVSVGSTGDTYVTGFTLNNNTITLSQNRSDSYSAFTISLSAYTGSTGVSGDYLPLSGGTVTGATQFTGGLTADTISATTYNNLPITGVTSGTGISITSTGGGGYQITNTSPNQTVSITGGTNIQITGTYPNFGVNFTGSTTGGTVSGDYLSLSGGTVTGGTIFQSGLTANTISATTYLNLPVSAVTNGTGISASTSNGTVTITNIAPDQTVTITGGTNMQIVGTYPNFGVNFTGSTTGGTSGDYLPLSGGTVTGNTTFTSGLTVNYIDFDTTPNVPSPTGGTLYFDSAENALSYKPITPSNDVTVNLGQESLIRIYNDLGFQINNGQALHITGSTSGSPTVSLAVGTGGDSVQFQISGIATHDIPNSSFGFMTVFGVVRDLNLTGFTVGEQIYLSQTVPGGLSSYSGLSITGRTCEVGHILDNSASGKIQVAILNEIEGTIITTQENNILAANNSSTGLFEFSGLSISTPSGTTFNVGPVEGWIIDNVTEPQNPTIQLIIYTGSTGNTALYVSSATETYILLTSGLTITQQTTFPTPQQRRQNLYLGKFGHANRQYLINAFNEPDSSLSPVSQLRDMFTPIRLINGGIYPSANGNSLTFNTSGGVLYGLGIGYITNKLDPNSLSVSGTSPCTFQYRTQTGGTASNTTLITPGVYDNNGVVTSVGGGSNSSTNQRIYLVQNGQFRLQYGQQVYGSLAAAIEASQNEAFTTFSNFRDNATLIGILSVNKNATNLSDTTQARFLLTSKFGETVGAAGGISTTNLQQAYNNSATPEIVTNSAEGALSIKNGTGAADNVTNLLEGQNSGGTTTSFIRADGAFSGTSIYGTGLSATTISATTYQNLPQSVSGAGTTNYVSKWTGSTGLGDSQIYDDGTFVGVGKISPIVTGSQFGVSTSIEVGSTQFADRSNSIGITDTNLTSWSTGGNEIAIGYGSPLSASQGNDNIAIGNSSLQTNSTGLYNVAIGTSSLLNNQAGQENVAIGHDAATNITSGSYNIAIGYGSLFQADVGNDNIVIGREAGQATSGNNNTVIGTSANQLGSSDTSVFLGYSAGLNATSNSSVFLGPNAGYNESSNQRLHIANTNLKTLIYGEFDNDLVKIGGTLSATTYQNLPTDVFVSAGTYSNGQITFTNTTGGTFDVTNIPIGGAGGQPYYLNLSVSQTPYQEFSPSATTAAQQSTGVTINSGVTTTIANFLTPVGFPNITLIPSGYWSFYLHAYRADGSTTFDIFTEVYKRTTGGTETLLLNTDPTEVLGIGTATMEISDGYYSGTTLNASDRILVKVRATNTGNVSSTITFLTEGTIHYSYGVTPFTNTSNVNSVSVSDGLSGNSSTGTISIINTDKGSSQNIFKNIQVAGVTQFSAGSNSSNLNFSGINITITSAATNTLVFSAGTGGGGAVSSVTAGSGLSGNSTTGAITLINTGVTGITAGTNISINQSTGNVTINSTGGGTGLGTVYTTANNFNFL